MDEDDIFFRVLVGVVIVGFVLGVCTGNKNTSDVDNNTVVDHKHMHTGTIVEKVDINAENSQTMLLIDTDGNKNNIEKSIILSRKSSNGDIIINNAKNGSQITFKDNYPHTINLASSDIYQIDDLIVNQR